MSLPGKEVFQFFQGNAETGAKGIKLSFLPLHFKKIFDVSMKKGNLPKKICHPYIREIYMSL